MIINNNKCNLWIILLKGSKVSNIEDNNEKFLGTNIN